MKPIVIFIFDDTFDGLLSCVFFAYEQKIYPDLIISVTEQQPLFFDYSYHIVTDEEKSNRVWRKLTNILSSIARKMLFSVWLSEIVDTNMLLFRYICKNIDAPSSIEMNFGDPDVIQISKIAKMVGSEAREIVQFLRFQQTKDNIYFAPVSPRYNVISMTTNHFKKRFADQQWIIFDTKRGFGFYYDLNEINEVTFEKSVLDSFTTGTLSEDKASETEMFFKEMWKTHFEHLTIMERLNLKLQRQKMPVRYWKYLPEMQLIMPQ